METQAEEIMAGEQMVQVTQRQTDAEESLPETARPMPMQMQVQPVHQEEATQLRTRTRAAVVTTLREVAASRTIPLGSAMRSLLPKVLREQSTQHLRQARSALGNQAIRFSRFMDAAAWERRSRATQTSATRTRA